MDINTSTLKFSMKRVKSKRDFYRAKYIRTKTMLNIALETLNGISEQKGSNFAVPANLSADRTVHLIKQISQLPLKKR